MGGFAYGSLHGYVDNIDHCTGFKGWTGYRAMSETGERRCFFLENKFPYRIKQGIERI
jgi:hypothetical protein